MRSTMNYSRWVKFSPLSESSVNWMRLRSKYSMLTSDDMLGMVVQLSASHSSAVPFMHRQPSGTTLIAASNETNYLENFCWDTLIKCFHGLLTAIIQIYRVATDWFYQAGAAKVQACKRELEWYLYISKIHLTFNHILNISVEIIAMPILSARSQHKSYLPHNSRCWCMHSSSTVHMTCCGIQMRVEFMHSNVPDGHFSVRLAMIRDANEINMDLKENC